jgi:hypothetical protein
LLKGPQIGEYDYDLGIEPDIIAYAKESLEITSRISPTPCYLLIQNPSGSTIGSAQSPAGTLTSYYVTTPNYRSIIWSGGVGSPDLRPYTNGGIGTFTVNIDGVQAVRVLDPNDLVNPNEFAVVKRYDLANGQVEVVLAPGYNPTGHTITYFYTTMESQISIESIKRGEGVDQSLFGWSQYLNSSQDKFHGVNQILVRMPLVTATLTINEEGKVKLQDENSWMIWTPYVHTFDILVVTSVLNPTAQEQRFEIVNKQDSMMQGTLMSQRFKLNYIEPTDSRYNIPYATV